MVQRRKIDAVRLGIPLGRCTPTCHAGRRTSSAPAVVLAIRSDTTAHSISAPSRLHGTAPLPAKCCAHSARYHRERANFGAPPSLTYFAIRFLRSPASDRLWYALRALTEGRTHNVLADRIAARLHEREGLAPSNFDDLLPANARSMALEQLATDPYRLDFIQLARDASERQFRNACASRALAPSLAFVPATRCR